jgi:hypothetical protein
MALLPFLGVSSLMTARPRAGLFFACSLAVKCAIARSDNLETPRNTTTTLRWERASRPLLVVTSGRTGHMTFPKLFGAATLAAAALSLTVVAPASAAPNGHHRHEHKVCKWERHHGHKQKVCRWVHD